MATGGDFGYDDPYLDKNIDNDGYDDDEQEVDRTQRFNPGQASTPYHGGEQMNMETMQHEQSGLPSYEEEETSFTDRSPLLSVQKISEQLWNALIGEFPDAKSTELNSTYGLTGRLEVKMAGFNKKSYPLFTTDMVTKQQKLNPKLPKEILKALGKRAEQKIAEVNITLQEQQQRLVEAEKQKQEAEKIAAAREEELQKIENLKQQTERTQARIDTLQEEHGSNLESESELRRLKQLKKNQQTELEIKKKEVDALEKQVKRDKQVQEKVQKERAKLDEIVKKRNLLQERLNSTKPLDDLNERKAELRQQNAEDQAIIDAEDASPSERQAAEARVEERNEELARLQTQITEREEAMPLRERVKEIFKKHGVTVTAILIAAGVTIGTVINALTKGLKATGKAVAGGLKQIATKLGSLLPGLIGQVASFLFNTAAKAVGFLAEHTWLLILAVVAFVFEKYIKKRR